ncbi:MAG TPA: DUF3574 domain-containing protein [Usitatibacter sp.]|nr:DUF3574 domain-containing protein [Usitatibacter sp.]
MPVRFAAIALAALLAGCAHCATGQQAAVSDILYFGTSKPGGTVSPQEWSEFLRDVVTPAFPDGFSAWPAYGQWKSGKGDIQREGSYVVSIVHREGDAAEAGIRALVAEYKSRFHQESVLRVSSPSCISF